MLTFMGIWAGCLLGLQPTADCEGTPALDRYEFAQIQMGVTFRIILYASDERTANLASEAAFAEIARLNGIMSDYDANSELMRLCRTARVGKPVAVSSDLLAVLGVSQELSCRSDGAFDVTVGPVVRLWRRARRRKELPSAERLREAKERVGFGLLRLDRAEKTATLLKSGMRLDLGGIAKGYAADRALAVLRDHGICRALVDGSGDMVMGDAPPGAGGWRIVIEGLRAECRGQRVEGKSQQPNSGIEGPLLLKNCAVATSGDAFQYVEIGGVRYSHIVDPRTGLGLTDRSTVTVIAPDGMAADSLASAVSVLGPERGLALIDRTAHTAARVERVEGSKIVRRQSKRWAASAGN